MHLCCTASNAETRIQTHVSRAHIAHQTKLFAEPFTRPQKAYIMGVSLHFYAFNHKHSDELLLRDLNRKRPAQDFHVFCGFAVLCFYIKVMAIGQEMHGLLVLGLFQGAYLC